jgi:hypothetical protein
VAVLTQVTVRFEKREMSRGTYLTHRLDPEGLALSLADVSRLSLLDHVRKFTTNAFRTGRGRIRGLSSSHFNFYFC